MTPTRTRRSAARRALASPSRRLLALLAVLIAIALVACRPPAEGSGSSASGSDAGRSVQVELASPPGLGPAELRVVVEQGGEPVEGASVEVTGDMTHAGMIPVIAAATGADGEAGVYLTEGFEFTMAGDWVLTVEVTYPDGSEVREEVFLNVPAP